MLTRELLHVFWGIIDEHSSQILLDLFRMGAATRIHLGKDAGDHEFPWMVALGYASKDASK